MRDDYTVHGIPAVPMSGEIAGSVGRAVQDLPPPYADVLQMTFGEHLSTREIAGLTGVPVRTVRWRRQRALLMLQERPVSPVRHPQDQMRYSRGTVEKLLPVALDRTWTGEMPPQDNGAKNRNKAPNEGGDGLVMVLDIRRALSGLPDWVERTFRKNDKAFWGDAVQAVLDFLNGWA